MNGIQWQSYLLPLLLLGFFLWRFLRFRNVRSQIPKLLQEGGVVVDVRSRGEFAAGSSEGSINIPLDELNEGSARLSLDQPIVLCCASGTRSGMAASLLKRKGFHKVVNAGSWKNTVNRV